MQNPLITVALPSKHETILCLCFYFFSRRTVHKSVVETNRYAEQFMNFRGTLFPFKSNVRQWTPVTEN
jgi:hypothetical protein